MEERSVAEFKEEPPKKQLKFVKEKFLKISNDATKEKLENFSLNIANRILYIQDLVVKKTVNLANLTELFYYM